MVRLRGRAGIEYRESGRVMSIDSEMLAGALFDMVIYRDSIKQWDPPYNSEAVTQEDRMRIEKNLMRELSKLRIDWQ